MFTLHRGNSRVIRSEELGQRDLTHQQYELTKRPKKIKKTKKKNGFTVTVTTL